MAYVALYRKFRPQKFEDMVGQEYITKTLKNQLINSRVAHAYLFSGGRGSGKTTTAKILARAVNCLNPINGEPCNECEICKHALEGTLTDISEIDAASNNGVDNIRDIREEVEFIPTNAKYRVYIIDEVHMLSTGAFNALLKTLEEPPKHVIFILATTEPQKLPITILSRCQRFDFKRISIEDIVRRLKIICAESNIEIEESALKIIAKMSDGAMRDAISILERCISSGTDKVTEEQIKEIVGIPEIEYLLEVTESLVTNNAEKALMESEKVINAGKDLDVFIWELVKFVRDLVMLQVSTDLVIYKDEELAKMQDLLKKANKDKLLELIAELSKLQSDMKWATDKEVIFETGLIRLAYQKVLMQPMTNVIQEKANTAPQASAVVSAEDKVKQDVLTTLKESHKMIMHTILSNSDIQKVEDDLVHIIFSKTLDEMNKQYMQKDESKVLIKEVMKKVFGKDMRIKYVF
ncbi:MAG: DNA polymerase III subunit gamma/tau [Clostridia bacterium]|nr:DNA polymerase III subunit gamma/tau [Clostridia bacterium]